MTDLDLIVLGDDDTTHPSGPAGPRPGGPPPPQPPYPTEPPKATGPTPTDPSAPDPMPVPHPTPQKHLVDHWFRIELFDRSSNLLAVAQLDNSAGAWWMQYPGQPPFFVGDREMAETAMRELVVAS